MILVQAAGNALVLLLGYYWLGVGESSGLRLVWSTLLALVLFAGVLWMQGAAMSSMRQAARNLAPLLLVGLAAILIYSALAAWKDYSAEPALKLASFLTLNGRKPVKPASVQTVFDAILFIVRWLVVPVLLLPLFAVTAREGLRGWRSRWFAAGWRRIYWLKAPALLLLALWLPLWLVRWVPVRGSFPLELTSFTLRAAIGFVLLTGGLLMLARVTAAPEAPSSASSSQ